MRFAGENQLHGTFWIAKQTNQAFRIVQQKIRPLVSREAPRKSHRQDMFIEDCSEIGRAPSALRAGMRSAYVPTR